MANLKISQLPVATSVADVDTHVIVQGGVTKKVTHAITLSAVNAELVAVNGLIDDINTAISNIPTAVTIYNSSGELFDTGTATTRNFLFKTSNDGTYNPTAAYHELQLNGSYNSVGGFSTSAGTFGMKAYKVGDSDYAWFNMFGAAAQVEMAAVDTANTRVRKVQADSEKVLLVSDTPNGGPVFMELRDTGIKLTDARTAGNARGMEYVADYSATIIPNDRSIPDVGTVNNLIANNATSIYNASGDVFNTGVATTRRFDFTTDQNVGYNPTGETIKLSFNAYSDYSNNLSSLPGTLGIKAQKTGNLLRYASINMFSVSETIELLAIDISVGERRTITVSPNEANIFTDTTTGNVKLLFNAGGAFFEDNRSSKLGLRYNADYSADLLTVDRAMTDVGIVKQLRQQANTWTTGTRPTAVAGVFGLNTTTSKFEGYDGTTWVDFH